MIILIVFSIVFFLTVTTAFGYPFSLEKTVNDEITSARLLNDANVQLFKVTAVDPFILAQELKGDEPLLRMVIIRARSSIGVKQLRGTHIDIIRVRSDPGRPPGNDLLSGGFIVEAVVTADQLNEIEAMGFEVSGISGEK